MRSGLLLRLGACLLIGGGLALADSSSDEALLKEIKISSEGPALLELIRHRTLGGDEEARIKKLIEQLGDDEFEKREQASQALVNIGSRARAQLERATMDSDLEVSRRAQDCLKQIEQGVTSVTLAAAVRVLVKKKPTGTMEVLLGYLPSAEDESVAEVVREGLSELTRQADKADPALVAALVDANPARRIGAGVALARADRAEQKEAVRKLLKDSDPVVRFRVGLALADKDRAAIPVLIDLLADSKLPVQEISLIEDFLYRLADDKPTPPVPTNEPAERRKYREAWQAWWKEHGKGIELTRLADSSKLLGCTLIVLLDQNQAMDLDSHNKPRFTIDGLDFPLDVQYLPGDRVLVAEHGGSRVTERNRDNKILWEKKIDQPLTAQRLPNGNTFIATKNQLMEVDRNDKVVFSHSLPGGELIMRAHKLRNGDLAIISQLGVTRFARLDRTGKEISSFGVDVRTSGGKVDVLPNGHVLIPENGNNRVVEYDAQGKVVWEATVDSPIVATRLPNGNTLITSMNAQKGAIEIDRAGKEVWQYKSETRVTRAYRR